MFKKIVPIVIVLFSITLSAISQTNDVALNTKIQNTASNKTGALVKHHVVIEVTSADSLVWKGVMNNVKHLKEKWGNNVQIEVVSHGPGIGMLVTAKTTEQKKIAELKKMGVGFLACENTMRAKKFSKELIIPEAGFVPSGVVEIVTKQEEGWSYLKAGF